ncbi:helix-turn-helix domain-containing protein [Methylorubrum sp. POS3]|uniref:helix-turn-helix domain-containing protein n=1 Tax=Methylorubrum sp. POS3 TaxID=2998492 RepID=UPI00372D1960
MVASNVAHDLLTLAEAAEATRISRRHLQALLQLDEGPPVIRLGRRLIIRREALQAWLVSRETSHASAA